jgi:hypothetical protein
MYPAQALVDGLYTVDDLPDEVQIGPYILQKGVAQAVFPVQVEGAFYGTISEGDEEAYIYLDNFAWNFGPAVGSGGQECLVDGNIVQDLFANSYTITYPPTSTSVVVTRISLCVWEGNDACGRPWYLMYGDQEPFAAGSPYYWNIWMAIDEGDPCGDFQQPIASKTGFQNTPVGSYLGNNNGTVS